jgi:integrase
LPKEKDPYRTAVYELAKVKKFIDRKRRIKENTAEGYLTGLCHFNRYLETVHKMNCNTIIDYLEKKPKEVYDFLDGFIVFLKDTIEGVKASTIRPYMYALLSYFPYYDIDIVSTKFKNKVSMPKKQKTKERPIKVEEIRKLLNSNSCTRRLKTYLLFLASAGCRSDSEACNVRNKDVNFDVSPTRVFVRAEDTKTDTDRYFYLTDEATYHLKQFRDWKYSESKRYVKDEEGNSKLVIIKPEYDDNDLLFSVYDKDDTQAKSIYTRLSQEWLDLLDAEKLNQVKEGGFKGRIRRQLTLTSFRRFAYTTVETQVNTGYAEFLLGHANSTYHTQPQEEIERIYKELCMPYLTFLDYSGLEAHGKSIEARLEALKEKYNQADEGLVMLAQLVKDMGSEFYKPEDKKSIEFSKRFLGVAEKVGWELKEVEEEEEK